MSRSSPKTPMTPAFSPGAREFRGRHKVLLRVISDYEAASSKEITASRSQLVVFSGDTQVDLTEDKFIPVYKLHSPQTKGYIPARVVQKIIDTDSLRTPPPPRAAPRTPLKSSTVSLSGSSRKVVYRQMDRVRDDAFDRLDDVVREADSKLRSCQALSNSLVERTVRLKSLISSDPAKLNSSKQLERSRIVAGDEDTSAILTSDVH